MRTLKFGVEIEFFGITKYDAVQAVRDAGIDCHDEGYNHTTRPYWKVVTDASVNSSGTGYSSGLELVSPILYEEDGLQQLNKALDAIKNAGAKVDRSCGVHVHHDVSDFTVTNFKNLYTFYYQYKNLIDAMLPVSRRDGNNSYCKGLTSYEIFEIRAADTIGEIKYEMDSRYVSLNIQSYVRYGTIEFRQHSGSVEFEKVSNWVELTFRMVEYATDNELKPLINYGTDLMILVQKFRKELKIQGTSVSKWIGKRIKKLSQAVDPTTQSSSSNMTW